MHVGTLKPGSPVQFHITILTQMLVCVKLGKVGAGKGVCLVVVAPAAQAQAQATLDFS
jgi:riboflavin synthase alpha subunit